MNSSENSYATYYNLKFKIHRKKFLEAYRGNDGQLFPNGIYLGNIRKEVHKNQPFLPEIISKFNKFSLKHLFCIQLKFKRAKHKHHISLKDITASYITNPSKRNFFFHFAIFDIFSNFH